MENRDTSYSQDLLVSVILSYLSPVSTEYATKGRTALVPSKDPLLDNRDGMTVDQVILTIILTSLMTMGII